VIGYTGLGGGCADDRCEIGGLNSTSHRERGKILGYFLAAWGGKFLCNAPRECTAWLVGDGAAGHLRVWVGDQLGVPARDFIYRAVSFHFVGVRSGQSGEKSSMEYIHTYPVGGLLVLD
jgi:hypothetical protein